MARKSWETAIGGPTVDPVDSDLLLSEKISERKRKQIARQEEEDEAAHTARMAELAKKTATSEAAVEKSGEKKEESGGIKVDGAFKLGTIDWQQEQKERIAERDRLREQAEESAAHQQQVSEELREKLHAAEIDVLKTSFNAQMQLITEMIKQNASKGSFAEQLNAAREIAKDLGFSQGKPNGGDLMIQIELKKLDFEQAKALRELTRAEKAEQRKWEMEIRRLDEEKEERKARLANDEKRLEFFKGAPKVLGEAIGQAILAGGVNKPISGKTGKAQHYEMPAEQGEGGSTVCPQCESEIGVGPTARLAVCSNCGTKITIKRTQPREKQEDTQPPDENEE